MNYLHQVCTWTILLAGLAQVWQHRHLCIEKALSSPSLGLLYVELAVKPQHHLPWSKHCWGRQCGSTQIQCQQRTNNAAGSVLALPKPKVTPTEHVLVLVPWVESRLVASGVLLHKCTVPSCDQRCCAGSTARTQQCAQPGQDKHRSHCCRLYQHCHIQGPLLCTPGLGQICTHSACWARRPWSGACHTR